MPENDAPLIEIVDPAVAAAKAAQAVENTSNNIAHIEGYVKHFDDQLLQQKKDLELLKDDIQSLIITLTNMAEQSSKAIADSSEAVVNVAAIRDYLEASSRAVQTTLPSINKSVAKNANRIDLINGKTIGYLRTIVFGGIIMFVSIIMWNTQTLKQRSDIANSYFKPMIPLLGTSIAGWIAYEYMQKKPEDDPPDDEQEEPEQER